ncbi:MAG: hypothetical protein AMXMBFR7_24340 [Planctomycetota bacterium]
MNAEELQRYIHANLPLTKAMGVTVQELAETHIRLGAPLLPNLNHKKTAFGGSLESLATVTAWSTLHVDLCRQGLRAELVIRQCEMSFLHPIDCDFSARAEFPSEADRARFRKLYDRRGMGSFTMACQVEAAGQISARFVGQFVAVKVP